MTREESVKIVRVGLAAIKQMQEAGLVATGYDFETNWNIICTFSSGGSVQYYDGYKWLDVDCPTFGKDVKYRVKPKYWRAVHHENYFFVDAGGEVLRTYEAGVTSDDERYELGNYFKEKEEANDVAPLIRTLFSMVREHGASKIKIFADYVGEQQK